MDALKKHFKMIKYDKVSMTEVWEENTHNSRDQGKLNLCNNQAAYMAEAWHTQVLSSPC